MSGVFRSFCIYVYLQWHDLQDRLWSHWHDAFANKYGQREAAPNQKDDDQ